MEYNHSIIIYKSIMLSTKRKQGKILSFRDVVELVVGDSEHERFSNDVVGRADGTESCDAGVAPMGQATSASTYICEFPSRINHWIIGGSQETVKHISRGGNDRAWSYRLIRG